MEDHCLSVFVGDDLVPRISYQVHQSATFFALSKLDLVNAQAKGCNRSGNPNDDARKV